LTNRYSLIYPLSGLLILLLASGSSSAADPTVRFELRDGAKVSDIVTIVARASTDDERGILKVEFAVDGKLFATDSSTPYSFDWDTLATTEGRHILMATAYDATGRFAQASITVIVDNELDRGSAYYTDTAFSAFQSGELNQALRYARRALKITPGHLQASRVLAGVYRRQGKLREAVEILEKANIPADDTEARTDLAALYIALADAATSTQGFLKEAARAVDAFRKLQTARAQSARRNLDTQESLLREGDAYFAMRDWTRAIAAYQKCGTADVAPMPCLNRLLLAYIYAERRRDADVLLRILLNSKRADTVTAALGGLLAIRNYRFTRARELVRGGIEKGELAACLVGAYVEAILREPRKAREAASRAFAIAPMVAEVRLLMAYTSPDPLDAHRAIISALENNPMLVEAYAARGFQTLLRRDRQRFASAEAMFRFALTIEPENTYALVGAALSLLAQRRAEEAEPLLLRALEKDPNAPDIRTALALCYSLRGNSSKVPSLLAEARRIDPERWDYFSPPDAIALISLIYNYRYPLMLSPTVLYPKES